MDGMLPAPNFGVIFDALIRWLDNRVITAIYDRECCTGRGGPSLCLAIFFILVVGSTPSQTRQASSWHRCCAGTRHHPNPRYEGLGPCWPPSRLVRMDDDRRRCEGKNAS